MFVNFKKFMHLKKSWSRKEFTKSWKNVHELESIQHFIKVHRFEKLAKLKNTKKCETKKILDLRIVHEILKMFMVWKFLQNFKKYFAIFIDVHKNDKYSSLKLTMKW